MNGTQFTDEQLLDLAGGDPDFAAEAAEELSKSALVDYLVGMRGVAGLSQAEVAQRMECSQPKVSKIENGYDADLSVGALMQYSEAVNCDLQIALIPGPTNAMERIRHHAFSIRAELERMTEVAGEDEQIIEGVGNAHIETLVNMIKLVSDSATKLPCNPETGAPRLRVNTSVQILPEQAIASEQKKADRSARAAPQKPSRGRQPSA